MINNTKTPTYFHIQIDEKVPMKWNVGDKHHTDEFDLNYFYQSIITGSERESESIKNRGGLKKIQPYLWQNLNNHLPPENQREEIDTRKLALNYKEISCDLIKASFLLTQGLREEIFENIRITEFPSKPSRKNCIWLSNRYDLRYWYQKIQGFSKGTPLNIFELRVSDNDKLHKADQIYVQSLEFGIETVQTNARAYWSGQTNDKSNIEFLYEGPYEIINELSLSDIN